MKNGRDSFCIYPFRQLHVASDGVARPCCAFEGRIEEDGRGLAAGESSVAELWNSESMRKIRRAMVEGRPVPGCGYCARYDALGLESIGRKTTEAWESGWVNPRGETAEEVRAAAAESDYRLPSPPEWLDLHVGNLCNLKCRMCCGYYSSAIAADPVHAEWDRRLVESLDLANPVYKGRGRPTGDWARRGDFLLDDLLREPARLRRVNLIGGEPLLIKEARRIMRYLVESGAAKGIVLSLTTNATVVDEDWCELAARFKAVVMAASLDGCGAVNDYIRHPSRWRGIEGSIARLRRLPNVQLYVNAAVQAYNLLCLVDLVDYCDEAGLAFRYVVLENPARLRPSAMPPSVRREAAARLRACAARRGPRVGDSLPELARVLEPGAEEFDPSLLREFMAFTRDLDRSRGQDFAAVFPELSGMIRAEGVL